MNCCSSYHLEAFNIVQLESLVCHKRADSIFETIPGHLAVFSLTMGLIINWNIMRFLIAKLHSVEKYIMKNGNTFTKIFHFHLWGLEVS
jgi:hypothetical protein